MEVLDTLQALSGGSEFLFPVDRNPRKPMSNMTILGALERMGFKGRMTGHGFCGLASTILHEQDTTTTLSNSSPPMRHGTRLALPTITHSTWSKEPE